MYVTSRRFWSAKARSRRRRRAFPSIRCRPADPFVSLFELSLAACAVPSAIHWQRGDGSCREVDRYARLRRRTAAPARTALRIVFHPIPVARPFLPPDEGSLTPRTGLARKTGLASSRRRARRSGPAAHSFSPASRGNSTGQQGHEQCPEHRETELPAQSGVPRWRDPTSNAPQIIGEERREPVDQQPDGCVCRQ